ncbi:MAG: phage/plasmid primase, P4 family, partial [Bacteroidota bacterium]
YVYNGAYWKILSDENIKWFLLGAAIRMGVDELVAKHFLFVDALYKQFMSTAILQSSESADTGTRINLKNGTFRIDKYGNTSITDFDPTDFLMYQLPFEYDTSKTAPIFIAFLNRVLPSIESQTVLAEYIGYLFISSSVLKLEKALYLYGTGANGKSVFFEIINAMLGKENVSNYSLESITKQDGYTRAVLSKKILNYASEISGKMDSSIFKALTSGEEIEAREIYGKPFTMKDYAKLMFNCNELPKEIEFTDAFFRRLMIIKFGVTIPENEQDKELAAKIIASELSGVFNWVLDGLKRVLVQRKFTECTEVKDAVEEYRTMSDSIRMFIDENGYEKSSNHTSLALVYEQYQEYCKDSGCFPCQKGRFSERLVNMGYKKERTSKGMVLFMNKKVTSSTTYATFPTPLQPSDPNTTSK